MYGGFKKPTSFSEVKLVLKIRASLSGGLEGGSLITVEVEGASVCSVSLKVQNKRDPEKPEELIRLLAH